MKADVEQTKAPLLTFYCYVYSTSILHQLYRPLNARSRNSHWTCFQVSIVLIKLNKLFQWMIIERCECGNETDKSVMINKRPMPFQNSVELLFSVQWLLYDVRDLMDDEMKACVLLLAFNDVCTIHSFIHDHDDYGISVYMFVMIFFLHVNKLKKIIATIIIIIIQINNNKKENYSTTIVFNVI